MANEWSLGGSGGEIAYRDYPLASWNSLPRDKDGDIEVRWQNGCTGGGRVAGGWGLHCRSSGSSNGNEEEEDPLWRGIRRLEGARTPAVGFSPSSPPTRRLLLPILWPATPFIGTPGIIRSEFVFSRPCAVLAVGVSSIRPATDYWTKTRG